MKSLMSQQGQKLLLPESFSERYDSSLNIRRYGENNLYPQNIREFFEASPTFHSCADRLREFLTGEGTSSNVIPSRVMQACLSDYAIFCGFAMFIQYNGLGQINNVKYIPFETIRLGEQGADGKYTYCYYNPDWSLNTTINKKKVTKQDSTKYWMFTSDIDTRLRRINDPGYTGGEVLYFSNSISYPTEKVRSVLPYVSAEIGCSNVIYRDVRTSFLQNSVLAIPRQSDDDSNEFAENLTSLQGDLNSYKILTVEFSSKEDIPQVLSLNSEDYTTRVTTVADTCRKAIVRTYGQDAFIRLEEGSLGFGSEAIADIYRYYNFQLRPVRREIETFLKQIDPTIEIREVQYGS